VQQFGTQDVLDARADRVLALLALEVAHGVGDARAEAGPQVRVELVVGGQARASSTLGLELCSSTNFSAKRPELLRTFWGGVVLERFDRPAQP
jgi:hypothetical protein